MCGAALGTLAVTAAVVAYMRETSTTLKADIVILIVAIVAGVGILTLRR